MNLTLGILSEVATGLLSDTTANIQRYKNSANIRAVTSKYEYMRMSA